GEHEAEDAGRAAGQPQQPEDARESRQQRQDESEPTADEQPDDDPRLPLLSHDGPFSDAPRGRSCLTALVGLRPKRDTTLSRRAREHIPRKYEMGPSRPAASPLRCRTRPTAVPLDLRLRVLR